MPSPLDHSRATGIDMNRSQYHCTMGENQGFS